MTRKRFIKLLMSIGYPRNKAREVAEIVTGDNRYCGRCNKTFKRNGAVKLFFPITYAEGYKILYRLYAERMTG